MSKVVTEDAISGSTINTMSDNLRQLLILPYHSITSNSKQKFFKETKNFSQNNFLSDPKKYIKKVYFPKINKMSTCLINSFWIK